MQPVFKSFEHQKFTSTDLHTLYQDKGYVCAKTLVSTLLSDLEENNIKIEFRHLKIKNFEGESAAGSKWYYFGTVNKKGLPHGIGIRCWVDGHMNEGVFIDGKNISEKSRGLCCRNVI